MRRLYHQTDRGQAQGSNRAPSASAGSSNRATQNAKKGGRATQNTKKRPCHRKCGRPCTTHQPLGQALSLAQHRCRRRPACPATPNPAPRKRPQPPASQQRAPRLPRNTPNPHATARLVAHFSRKTTERKVTHITNKIIITHSYTTYGNTRGTEKGNIAKTLSYPDIFCHNTT